MTEFSGRWCVIYHFAKDNVGERFFSKNIEDGTVFVYSIAETRLFFIVDFDLRTGRAEMRTRSFFFVAKLAIFCRKIGDFARRILQNFAKLCKKNQKFARKFAYIKKKYYLCNGFRKRAETNPKKLTNKTTKK